jgi:RimJ/RimL family protein N-acetyltransferase
LTGTGGSVSDPGQFGERPGNQAGRRCDDKPVEHFSTGRLIARDWATADAEDAFAIYGREEVARWLGAPPPRRMASVDVMRANLERISARNAQHPQFGHWALELRGSGTVIGAVVLLPLPGGGEVEIGWHLNPDHWGQGYATEAGRGAIRHAFGACGLAEVLAVVYPDNAKSIAVCRRLGMTHLGQTDRYFGVTLALFRLRAADAPAAADTVVAG